LSSSDPLHNSSIQEVRFAVTELLTIVLQLIPLDVLANAPSPTPVRGAYPRGNQGFAAYIIGGFIGLGILVLAMALLNRRPKRPGRRPLDQ
jgi:hypothetical protein